MAPTFLLDPLPGWIATGWLASLMVQAAWMKSRDRALWVQHLAAYRVPLWALAVLSVLLPVAEGVCGVMLLTPWRSSAAMACAVLLLIYAVAMARHLLAGRQLDCGCGGEPLPLSWALVARNAVLLAVCGLVSVPTTSRPLGWTDGAVILAALLMGMMVWALFHQVLRHSRSTAAA